MIDRTSSLEGTSTSGIQKDTTQTDGTQTDGIVSDPILQDPDLMMDDRDGGTDPEPTWPPSVTVAITSASVQQAWVRPGGQASVVLKGTVSYAEGEPVPEWHTLEIQVTAGSGTSTLSVSPDGGSWTHTATVTAGQMTGTVSVTAKAVAKYKFYGSTTVKSVTHSKSTTVTVPVDGTGPTLTASTPAGRVFGCPPPNGTLPVAVSGTVSDANSGIAWVKVGADANNLPAVAVQADGSWQTTVSLPARLGTQTIYVRAADGVGNTASNDLTVEQVDRTAPEVKLDAPPRLVYDNAALDLPVGGSVLDLHSAVQWVKVSLKGIDGSAVVTDQAASLLTPYGAGQTARWGTTLRIPAPGDYTVSVRAADVPGNASQPPVSATVSADAIPEPSVIISSHRTGDVVPGDDQGAAVTLRGEASAPLSSLIKVQVRVGDDWVGDAGFVDAVAEAADWSRWRAEVHIPPEGSHTVLVRATNTAANPDSRYGHASITLRVGVAYGPQEGGDSTTLRVYFRDLKKFALRRVRITENGKPARALLPADLERDFFQPFDPVAADEPVAQIRLCIEVLRRYLASMQRTPDQAGEAAYRELAYRALLVQFGTSYEELRASRTGSPAERAALADRLGIDAARLAELFLSPDAVTEAALESVFGLRDTDPATPGIPGLPVLFRRQVEYLRALWRAEDQAAGAAAPPILDPDLVGVDSIPESKRLDANLAYSLLMLRKAWMQAHLAALAADVRAGESDGARLARLVGAAVASASMADLLALEQQRANGVDIVPVLATHGLTLPAFTFLVRMHAAAGNGALLSSEWSELHSLLGALEKRRRYPVWRTEESALVLGPDDFQAATEPPRLPAWRATMEDWRAWQEKLRARTDQMESLRVGYQDSIEAAEAAALPALRDALVAAAGAGADEEVDVANWLTQRLMIDVQASSTLRTSRATQAIETLQGILAALRAGRFMEMDAQPGPLPLGTWTLTVPDVPEARVGEVFDQEWTWMGSFSSWRAAMRVFLYPENLLLPGLRNQVTPEFREMLAAGGSARLSAQGARDMAATYLEELQANTQVWQALAALKPAWREQSFVLDETIAEAHLVARATAIREMMTANRGAQPVQRYLEELFFFVPVQLGLLLHRAGQFTAALDWFRTVYGYNLPAGQRKVFHGLKQEESNPCTYQTTDQWLRTTLNPHDIAPERAGAYTRFTILSIARCFVEYGDVEFANESGEATARARTLYLAAMELLGSADMRLPNGDEPAVSFGFAANPEALALRMHAELNLFKLRNGRNIAGMQRQVVRGGGGESARGAASPAALQPTPYRFPVLIDRAKQLVSLAQQMEAQYLAAMEKQDAETYNLIKARHDLSLTEATVHLQDLRIGEASGGVSLAALQQSRATVQKSTYQQWINGGEIQAEKDLLQSYRDINRLRNWTAGIDAALTTAQTLTAASSGGFLGTGLGAGLGGTILVGALAVTRAGFQMSTNDAEARSQAASFRASYERRKQEWQLQSSLAEKDEQIGAQQVVQARHQLQIVTQERSIAQMQANNAHATVEFLANKFTNAELYEWMSGVLGRVYSYFLQQATAIGRLAEAQLAFERQEKPLSLVQADYWEISADASAAATDGGTERDRRGLTGSARLLQDIYKLDQYAFETNKRKLQLTRTISLAQLAPFELEHFRRTGSLVFATPMELFDRDFPGQYLRLVRRVRTSVVALVPPNQGIRATLSASGLSRVTVADGGFQTVALRRDPESISLTSPNSATGLFELDPQAELLMPFEGMGVDTTWTFEMPRAANPFDFGTVADILLTVEYTALQSYDYRQQVIRSLGTRVSAERAFSFRDTFPDQWYALANGNAGAPAAASFRIRREDFPPNLDQLRVESLLLHFVPKDGPAGTARVTDLRFPTQTGTASAGAAEAVEGVISTRRNRWSSVIGARPVAGEWRLELDGETAQRFRAGELEDLLLVVGYGAEGPAWI